MIINFLLPIFAKYVAVLSNVKVVDAYSVPGSTKNRFIDLALVDRRRCDRRDRSKETLR